jgi:probable addiction module antidote protein
MEKVTFSKWDLAENINTKEDVIAYLEGGLEDIIYENDNSFLLKVINALARAEGMTQIARELGITREGLYKSLSPNGNPSFETVIKLLNVLGLSLKIVSKDSAVSENKTSHLMAMS